MNLYSLISQNKWKSWLIMGLFVVFIVTIAYVIGEASAGGLFYAGFAFIASGVTSLTSYFYADKMVLATSGARPVTKEDVPLVYNSVENLTIGAGMPMPKIYIIDDPSPNAFATGRDPKHAAIAVTTGLLERLNKAELEGVLAHELSHIRNFDTRLLAITAILVGFVAILADIFMRNVMWGGIRKDAERDNRMQVLFLISGVILALLSPVVASLMQLAVSRKREFLADASGVLLTRFPEGLASALEKISSDPQPVRNATNATAHMYIENPFKKTNTARWLASLFNTHPPIQERIKILRSM
jgi:heat shock protein HtpX